MNMNCCREDKDTHYKEFIKGARELLVPEQQEWSTVAQKQYREGAKYRKCKGFQDEVTRSTEKV